MDDNIQLGRVIRRSISSTPTDEQDTQESEVGVEPTARIQELNLPHEEYDIQGDSVAKIESFSMPKTEETVKDLNSEFSDLAEIQENIEKIEEFNTAPKITQSVNKGLFTLLTNRIRPVIAHRYVTLTIFFILSFVGALTFFGHSYQPDSSKVQNGIKGESTLIVTDERAFENSSQENRNSVVASPSRNLNIGQSSRIAYITSGNIWLMNIDGSNKIQLTDQGGIFAPFKNLAWKNSSELSYSTCFSGECSVYTYNLSSDSQSQTMTLQAPAINKMRWSPDGQSLYVNYVKPDGRFESVKRSNEGQIIVLKTNELAKGKVYTDNDQIDFVFSQGGDYVAVINTVVNADSEDFITIFDRNAIQVSTIGGESKFPRFVDEGSIYFKSDGSLFKGRIGSIQSKNIIESFEGSFYDISKDESHIVYWTFDQSGTLPITKHYNTSTAELRDIQQSFKVQSFISESVILGFVVENYQSIHQYGMQKLGIIDLNGNLSILENSNVTEFDISRY